LYALKEEENSVSIHYILCLMCNLII